MNAPDPAPIRSGEDYIRSLRGRKLDVWLFGERVAEPVDHPVIRPSINAVAETYDLALRNPEMIATTFGRHVNDNVTSFYSWSPSKFMFEYGWGGRTIDVDNWEPKVITEGPSLWGHERSWISEEQRIEARNLRIGNAADGLRIPLNVMDGNYQRARDVCPWWDATAPATRKTG